MRRPVTPGGGYVTTLFGHHTYDLGFLGFAVLGSVHELNACSSAD